MFASVEPEAKQKSFVAVVEQERQVKDPGHKTAMAGVVQVQVD